MIQCQGLEREVALSKDKQGTWGLGGSDCSVYCSHGPDKVTPAQLPRSGNAHQPPHSSCTAKPQVEDEAGHVVLYYLVVLKEPSLLDVCPVFILGAERGPGVRAHGLTHRFREIQDLNITRLV